MFTKDELKALRRICDAANNFNRLEFEKFKRELDRYKKSRSTNGWVEDIKFAIDDGLKLIADGIRGTCPPRLDRYISMYEDMLREMDKDDEPDRSILKEILKIAQQVKQKFKAVR